MANWTNRSKDDWEKLTPQFKMLYLDLGFDRFSQCVNGCIRKHGEFAPTLAQFSSYTSAENEKPPTIVCQMCKGNQPAPGWTWGKFPDAYGTGGEATLCRHQGRQTWELSRMSAEEDCRLNPDNYPTTEEVREMVSKTLAKFRGKGVIE